MVENFKKIVTFYQIKSHLSTLAMLEVPLELNQERFNADGCLTEGVSLESKDHQ